MKNIVFNVGLMNNSLKSWRVLEFIVGSIEKCKISGCQEELKLKDSEKEKNSKYAQEKKKKENEKIEKGWAGIGENMFTDIDNDGILDDEEFAYGTNSQDPDTDNDGYFDGEELKGGYNPSGSGKINYPQKIKTDKVVVEFFTTSQSYYFSKTGKKLLPAIEQLGGKVDFKVKFFDHIFNGEKELQEELKEYCIQEEQNDKFFNYLKCFWDKGDSENCLVKNNINRDELNDCVKRMDEKFNIWDNFNNKEKWTKTYEPSLNEKLPKFDIYKAEEEKYHFNRLIQGAVLVINNVGICPYNMDSQKFLNKICSAFTEVPVECDKILPSN
jgi:hypothetical protein